MNAVTPRSVAPINRPPSRSWRRRLWRGLLCLGGAFLLAVVGGWFAVDLVPLPPALFQAPPPPVQLLDREGRPLRQLRDNEGFVGRRVSLDEMPQSLVDATLAAEDKRFWSHPGVDWRATLRAAVDCLRYRKIVSGASTITQQLVKLADPRPRTLKTKVIEAARALRLERVWSKQRILAQYLNWIDYGNFNRGAAAAAEFYFDKPLKALTVAEAALLAGLPQAPSRHNPHTNPDGALRRRRYVLQRMLANGWLDRPAFSRAMTEPLRLAPPSRAFRAPHFVDFLIQRQQQHPTLPATGQVRTTLDLDLQTQAGTILRRRLAALADHHVRQGAVVILHNPTGDVLALVGSPDYLSPEAGQVNGAWAPRSAGSTLKPFTYLLAFEQGLSPARVVADIPSTFPTATGTFSPVNYDRRFRGPVRCRVALANSLNVPAVRVLNQVGGPTPLWETLQACGLTTLTQPPDFYGLGLTIGNSEVRLLELANAYACLARLGVYRPWRLIPNDSAGEGRRLFRPDCAWWIADILDDDEARRAEFGWDSPLRFDFPVACKTGTSSDFRDNWTFGYTPEFTVGVWVGNFDGSPMREVSGVSGAGPVFHELFALLHRRFGTTWYRQPPGMVAARVHPFLGQRVPPPTRDTPSFLRAAWNSAVSEVFLAEALPPLLTAQDFDASGRPRLPASYADWLAHHLRPDGQPEFSVATPEHLRITWPHPGTVLFLDPDLPESSSRVRLQAIGPADVIWHSDTLLLESAGGHHWAHLNPGRHRLDAQVPGTNEKQETWIEVRRL